MVNKKVLVVAPHADDEILGCGGFISKYSKKNYKINVLILTNANLGAPEIYSSNEIIKIRNESKKANKIIGTHKIFYENLPALNLNNFPHYKISNMIEKYINIIEPEIVFIPSSNDINDDHKIIFKTSKVAMRTKKNNSIKKIYSYEVLSETEWNEDEKSFNPNYFISLNKSDINRKVRAFSEYKSQIKSYPHPRSKDGIINLSKVRGSQVHMNYAEAFKVEKILD